MSSLALLIVSLLLVSFPDAKPKEIVSTALTLAQTDPFHPDRDLAGILAVMQIETGGTLRSDLVSRANACGIMQVIPKWSVFSCKDMSSPLSGVLAGMYAWEYWKGVATLHPIAAHYNGGNRPGKHSKRREQSLAYDYADKWSDHRERILGDMRRLGQLSPKPPQGPHG